MLDFRYYLVTISAVFIALATGILIGTTYGDDFLIYNQLEVIEQLERELNISREKAVMLEKEVSLWSGFQDFFWTEVYADLFKGYLQVTVLSDSFTLAREIVDLMESKGITCRVIVLTAHLETSLKEEENKFLTGKYEPEEYSTTGRPLGALLGGDAGFLFYLRDAGKIDLWGNFTAGWESKTFVILSEANSGAAPFLEEAALFLKHQESRTIAAFSARGAKLPDSYLEWGETVIDHLDTFWGRLSLLEAIRTGTKGHFGFESSLGIFPLKGR